MKEYWYKRTFADGKKGGYLRRDEETVLEIRKAQELDKAKGQSPLFTLKEAKWWYYPYRYLYDNKVALWGLILSIFGAILGAYFSHIWK